MTTYACPSGANFRLGQTFYFIQSIGVEAQNASFEDFRNLKFILKYFRNLKNFRILNSILKTQFKLQKFRSSESKNFQNSHFGRLGPFDCLCLPFRCKHLIRTDILLYIEHRCRRHNASFENFQNLKFILKNFRNLKKIQILNSILKTQFKLQKFRS